MQSSRKQTSKAPNLSTNIRRQRIRPAKVKTTSKGMTYSVSLETTSIATNASGVATGFLAIDPMYYLSKQVGIVGTTFQFYKIKAFATTWVPLVGATTGGVVRMVYSDNPEVVFKVFNGTYTSTDILSLTQQSQHNRRYPIWQESTYPCPNQLNNRRPKYSLDSSIAANAETCDRVTQAIGIFHWTGPISTAIGYLAVDLTVEFMEPVPQTSSPLFMTSPGDRKKDCSEDPMYEPAPELN